MAAATAAPAAFLTAGKSKMVIDEVQLVPELFRSLKQVVDNLRMQEKKQVNGRYLLTGSANILALPKLSDPLVGRMSVLTLYPFSAAEVTEGSGEALDRLLNLDFSGMSDRGFSLLKVIQMASFPELVGMDARERRIWLDGYLATILQKDVRMIADLEKISVLPNLLRILAARTANLVNDADIARDLGLNPVTTKAYRNILKLMFLNMDVAPWFRNIGKRLVKSPKGYLLDCLLLCHMLDLDIEEMPVRRPELFGHLLENFVATELVKLLSFSGERASLYHFRTSDGKEVDFILEKPDGSLYAIEVKKTESVL